MDATLVRSEGVNHHKVLRVPPGWRNINDGVFGLFLRHPEKNQRIKEVFEREGFVVVEGGKFDHSNPSEIGIHLGGDDPFSNKVDLGTHIAQEVNVNMPRNILPEDVLISTEPVVAKEKHTHRGEKMYLLETSDQKVKFITCQLLGEKLRNLPSDKKMKSIFADVRKGKLNGSWVGKYPFLHSYFFQTFVSPPGEYYTSIRIVVDAFGKVHYGQLHRSAEKQEDSYLPDDHWDGELDVHYSPELGKSLDLTEVMLRNPRSGFYLKSKHIASNIARGGRRILLDGRSVTDENDRKVLEVHGIDPDMPLIPEVVKEKASAIGKVLRPYYPYTGIDFLIAKNETPYFLEANTDPGINPVAIGLPNDANDLEAAVEMMKRVCLSAK